MQNDIDKDKYAILKIELDGIWKVSEFEQFLRELDLIYKRINTLIYLSKTQKEYFINKDFPFGIYKLEKISDNELEPFYFMAGKGTSELWIHSLNIASPGWLEVIASSNPLKIIADFITAWRDKNTQRDKIKKEHKEAMEWIKNEQRKINADLLKYMIDKGMVNPQNLHHSISEIHYLIQTY